MKKIILALTCLFMSVGIFAQNAEKVVFDPATMWDGEKIEIDGKVYAVIEPDEYNTFIDIADVELKKIRQTFTAIAGAEENWDYNCVIVLKDADLNDVVTIEQYGLPGTPAEKKIFGHSKQQPWNKVSKTKIVDKVQIYIQDGKAYKPQKGIKVYIGKIYSK